MKRIIIGEGSYGCVHKPSIHCKTPPKPNFDYKKYVSKIMKTKNAEKELEEFVVIGKFDPENKFHLGEPILCQPNLDEANVKQDIQRCKNIKINEIEENPDKYSLLVLKFGGPDLKSLCNKYLEKYLEKDKQIRTDKFWLEVHHLIKGIKFFKENGIIHNDIKPQNILFDSTNGKMKYIDFGLMRTKNEVMNSSKNNTNFLGIYHWSYPFDCGLMEKKQYNNYKGRSASRRTYWKNSLSELIIADSKSNPLDLPITNPEAFNILFTYLNPDNKIPDSATQYGYINSFFDGFDDLIKTETYDTVLNLISDSIDVFGLGFSLQFMANCFKRINGLSLEDYTKLSIFFHKMYDFNPKNRIIDIDSLLNEYENLLLEIGVLTRLSKSFENNNIVNKPPAPKVIMVESKSDEKSPPKKLSPILQEYADNDPVEITVKCKEYQEFNPFTKRCVKKCKEGFTRDEKFKCYSVAKKNKNLQSIKMKSIKLCSSDQELNPKTSRCVKKCKEGFTRDENFKCYSVRKRVKTHKNYITKNNAKYKSRSRKRH